MSVEERRARGRAARREVARSSHAGFTPPRRRPDPVSLLLEQAKTREPTLTPIRHGRMLVSPFTFFRGAALVMASDLAATPVSGIQVQICGDAHLSNFGGFASPERNLVFDLNDFDETLPGPWEWDVKRLLASLEVAGRDNGYPAATRSSLEMEAIAEYRRAIEGFAGMPNLEVWYSRLDIDSLLPSAAKVIDPKSMKVIERDLAKARTRDSMQALSKLTKVVDGVPRIISDPPLIVPLQEIVDEADFDPLRSELVRLLRSYRGTLDPERRHLLDQFELIELARKVVGVGSVGTRSWMGLFVGRDNGDPLFLQMKEAQPSVYERFVGASPYPNHGQRVVAGHRLMQAATDIFLGWQRVVGADGVSRDFYVRQLRDWKWSADIGTLPAPGMALWGRLCAWTLARAHARSGDRIAIAGYLGRGTAFDRAVVAFATAYADQNERDYAGFAKAVKFGRVEAVTGL